MKELPTPYLSHWLHSPLFGAVLEPEAPVWLLEPLSVSAPRAYLCLMTLAQNLRSTPCAGLGRLISGGWFKCRLQ